MEFRGNVRCHRNRHRNQSRHLSLFAAAIVALLSPVALSAKPPTEDATLAAKLDAQVPGVLKATKVPSLSIAVLRNGKPVLIRAWGEQAPGVPATTRTLYNTASLAKPLTATVILTMISQRKLGLDDRMADHWIDPDIADDPRTKQLTPRQSMSHQTGFPNWRDGKLAFKFDPGTNYSYSGEGVEYLVAYAQKKTGKRLDTLAARHVLRPLGMTSTAFTEQSWFAGRVAQPFAGGKYIAPSFQKEPLGSDDVYTTPSDYARLVQVAMSGKGMTKAVLAEQRRIQTGDKGTQCPPAIKATCPARSGFGLGWQLFEFGPKTVMMHTGNDAGEFTFAYAIPSTGEAVVIMTNASNGPQAVVPLIDTLGMDPEFATYLKGLASQ
jgi:CubicO group peptidase (beta-lactamase class C family)